MSSAFCSALSSCFLTAVLFELDAVDFDFMQSAIDVADVTIAFTIVSAFSFSSPASSQPKICKGATSARVAVFATSFAWASDMTALRASTP